MHHGMKGHSKMQGECAADHALYKSRMLSWQALKAYTAHRVKLRLQHNKDSTRILCHPAEPIVMEVLCVNNVK